MAKAAGRKLKVFQAQFGFYDTVVAAASQAAAFKAIMRELGSPASAQLTEIYREHMEAHTESLRPVWDSIKVDFPAFRGARACGA